MISLQVPEAIATKIRFMAESGVFAIETGNASLNFLNGKLKSIKTEMMSYPHLDPEKVDIFHIKPIL